MNGTLLEALTWEAHAVPATIAAPSVGVSIGRAGSGSPVGLLVAGQHGDEGPWGTRAIMRFLETTPSDALRGSLRVVPVANPLADEENSRPGPIAGIRRGWRPSYANEPSTAPTSCSTCTAAAAGA